MEGSESGLVKAASATLSPNGREARALFVTGHGDSRRRQAVGGVRSAEQWAALTDR